ncbi:MAG: hypothetical protein JW819_08015 [Candidatus Krumholzibacteriota bacterium]|nr:hypothetical protein [Candidatus Krumholzibacteriota bacterium]
MLFERHPVLVRGAGELASAVALHLHRAGFPLVMTDLPQPLAVRRLVAFGEAVRHGAWTVEGVTARICGSAGVDAAAGDAAGDAAPAADPAGRAADIREAWREGRIALCVDAGLELLAALPCFAVLDARMLKRADGVQRGRAPLTLALGPGIRAGEHVDAVVETQRGHDLGRIITDGEAAPNTGEPGVLGGESARRVCRTPAAGIFRARARIGDLVAAQALLAVVEDGGRVAGEVRARIAGRLRGLLADGTIVPAGIKAADVDPRGEAVDPARVSDKGRAVAAGVLTALLEALGRAGPAGAPGAADAGVALRGGGSPRPGGDGGPA